MTDENLEISDIAKESKKKRGKLNGGEVQFIKDNYLRMTDQQIADSFNPPCSAKTVEKKRYELNLTKYGLKEDDTKTLLRTNETEVKTTLNQGQMSNSELYDFHRAKFMASTRFKRISKLVTADELEIFCDDWANYHLLLDDINFAEENDIEQWIIVKLRMDECQRQYNQQLKLVEDLLERAGVVDMGDLANDPENFEMFSKIGIAKTQALAMNKELRELGERLDALTKSLNVTRSQREAKGKIGGDTFFTKCQEFTKKSYRDKEGRNAELLRKATEINMDKLRQGIRFADGAVEPQLLDDKTVEQMEVQQKPQLETDKEITNGN